MNLKEKQVARALIEVIIQNPKAAKRILKIEHDNEKLTWIKPLVDYILRGNYFNHVTEARRIVESDLSGLHQKIAIAALVNYERRDRIWMQ